MEQKVAKINEDVVRKILQGKKRGKAVGHDNIPVWKGLEEAAAEFLLDCLTRSWRVRCCLRNGGEF